MKYVIATLVLFVSLAARAQYTSFQPEPTTSATSRVSTQKEKKTKKTSAKEEVPEMKIEAKYASGSCPEVNGKVEWSETFACPDMSAQQVYDKVIAFLLDYCKQEGKEPESRIAIVNKETHEIGARISEYVTFRDQTLVRDRALLNYTLRVNCHDGKCEAIMQNMSYKYDGRTFPAEEMLLDKNALNKTKTDFRKGGFRKFRTKTIDAKDEQMRQLREALAQITQ